MIRVIINGVDQGEFAKTNGTSTIGKIVIYGNKGDDNITINPDLGAISTVIYGDAGNDTIHGGNGYNVVIAGEGNDIIYGGESSDLLIGDAGQDNINGDKGDDILISGSYRYSQDLNALAALLAAWIEPITYTQRISNLKNGVGFDSVYALNTSNVIDDNAIDSITVDTLNGLQGQDWFLISSTDKTDTKGNETVN